MWTIHPHMVIPTYFLPMCNTSNSNLRSLHFLGMQWQQRISYKKDNVYSLVICSRFQFIDEIIHEGFHIPSLTTLKTWSWSSETVANSVCISYRIGIGWGPFGLRGTYFHCFMYMCFSHWSSTHPSSPIQS